MNFKDRMNSHLKQDSLTEFLINLHDLVILGKIFGVLPTTQMMFFPQGPETAFQDFINLSLLV